MTSRTSRRHLLRTAAWTVPAITVAASAPAFAASSEPSAASQARMSFQASETDPTEAGQITVTNPSSEDLTVTLSFSPVPDEDAPYSLMSYSGFAGFAQITGGGGFRLRGVVKAGQSASGWCWWRDNAGVQGFTTVDVTFEGPDGSATPEPQRISIT